jgi:hypothetical protein
MASTAFTVDARIRPPAIDTGMAAIVVATFVHAAAVYADIKARALVAVLAGAVVRRGRRRVIVIVVSIVIAAKDFASSRLGSLLSAALECTRACPVKARTRFTRVGA